MRNSRDWISNRWVEMEPKPDIVAFLSSKGIQIPRLSPGSSTMGVLLGPGDNRVSTPDIGDIMEDEQGVPDQTDPDELVKEEAASSQ